MRKFKKVIALVMAGVLLSFPLNVGATDQTNITARPLLGTSTLVSPVLRVTLPSAIATTLDPYAIRSEDRISSVDYAVVNRSNVPVVVEALFGVIPGTTGTGQSTTIVVDIATENDDDAIQELEDKTAFVQLQLASDVGNDASFLNALAATGSTNTIDWDYTDAALITLDSVLRDGEAVPAVAGVNTLLTREDSKSEKVYFVLKESPYDPPIGTANPLITVGPVPDEALGGFSIKGDLSVTDPEHVWAQNDVRIAVVFSFKPISENAYEVIIAGEGDIEEIENALNAFIEPEDDD